jgi:predicted metallopeptidase
MKYFKAPDIEAKMRDVFEKLGMVHDISRIICIRSRGSKSRRALGRCHTTSRAVQAALGIKAHYIIEIISENYDRLPEEEKTKTIIHELMHIPKAFGGGFKGHRVVNRRAVDEMYRRYVRSV